MSRSKLAFLSLILFASIFQIKAQVKPLVMEEVGAEFHGANIKDMAVLDNGVTVIVGQKFDENVKKYGYIAWVTPDGQLIREVLLGKDTWRGSCSLSVVLPEPGTNSVYVAGYTHCHSGRLACTAVGDSDALLAKYDEFGNESWLKLIKKREDNYVIGLALDDKGNIVAAATEGKSLADQNSMKLLTYSPSGMPVRSVQAQLPFTSITSFTRFIGNGDGTYWHIMTGKNHTNRGKSARDMILVKYNSQGNIINQYSFASEETMHYGNFERTRDGGLLISGISRGTSGVFPKPGAYILRFDQNAQLLWTKSWNGTGYQDPVITAIEMPNGDIFATFYGPDAVKGLPPAFKTYTHVYMVHLSSEGDLKSYKNLAALTHLQSPEQLAYKNGKIYMGIIGQNKTTGDKMFEYNPWLCVVDGFWE